MMPYRAEFASSALNDVSVHKQEKNLPILTPHTLGVGVWSILCKLLPLDGFSLSILTAIFQVDLG